MSKQNFTLPCGKCGGGGQVPLPDGPARILALLRKRSPATVKELYRGMPRGWRTKHNQSNVHRYLGILWSVGAAQMDGKRGHAVLWRPAEQSGLCDSALPVEVAVE